MLKKWCEHITFEHEKYYYNYEYQITMWNHCPICGAARPPESVKDLLCVIDFASKNWGLPLSGGMLRTITEAVRDWFCELVESMPEECTCTVKRQPSCRGCIKADKSKEILEKLRNENGAQKRM